MSEALKKITAKYNLLGFWGICKCLFTNIFLNILWLVFHFERWHVSSSFACRTYKKVTVDAINKVNPETVVELGCGLGEIIGRIKSRRRIGIDIDERVLSAAKFLYGRNVEFQKGSFEEISRINEDYIDVLVMCNWIHNIDPKSLRMEIEKLLKKKKIKYIIVDSIEVNIEGYKYKHDINELFSGIAKLIKDTNDGGEEIRKICTLECLFTTNRQ